MQTHANTLRSTVCPKHLWDVWRHSEPQSNRDYNEPILVQVAFFEFTTGAPHPLWSTHTLLLPPLSETFIFAKVLGDHNLVLVRNLEVKTVLYLVLWKTGTVTLMSGLVQSCVIPDLGKTLKLCELPDKSTKVWIERLTVVVINSSLITLIRDRENSLEICKLEIASSAPCLQTLCFLKLPLLVPDASFCLCMVHREWVPTSTSYTRSRSS